MQINCISQRKDIHHKKKQDFSPISAHTDSTVRDMKPVTSVTGVRKDLAFFNYARTREHPSNLASKLER